MSIFGVTGITSVIGAPALTSKTAVLYKRQLHVITTVVGALKKTTLETTEIKRITA